MELNELQNRRTREEMLCVRCQSYYLNIAREEQVEDDCSIGENVNLRVECPLFVVRTLDQKLRKEIMDHLERFGGDLKRESISYLKKELNAHYWRGLGNLEDFADTVEGLGFEIVTERENTGRPIRFVTIKK